MQQAERLAALRLPRDDGGPVFAEPWQAQAFALAVTLSERGHFTWPEWAATLADELRAAAARGEPDDGTRYYEHWLAALERLVTDQGPGRSERAADAQGRLDRRLPQHAARPTGRTAASAGHRRGTLARASGSRPLARRTG